MFDPRLQLNDAKRREIRRALLKLNRRLHLWSGLLLWPWALLFGLSGFLFNHPYAGVDVTTQSFDRAEIEARTGFRGLDPQLLSEQALAALKADGESGFELDDSFTPHFEGWALLSASHAKGRHSLAVELSGAEAQLTSLPSPVTAKRPAFARDRLDIENPAYPAAAQRFSGFLEDVGIHGAESLKMHRRFSPDLRFRLRDDGGRLYNASLDLKSLELRGRAVDGETGISWMSLVKRMHTTHHYPNAVNVEWLWILSADMMGLTLIFWALSGLIMWTQIKVTRRVGALLVSLSILLGAGMYMAMERDIRFEGRQARR